MAVTRIEEGGDDDDTIRFDIAGPILGYWKHDAYFQITI